MRCASRCWPCRPRIPISCSTSTAATTRAAATRGTRRVQGRAARTSSASSGRAIRTRCRSTRRRAITSRPGTSLTAHWRINPAVTLTSITAFEGLHRWYQDDEDYSAFDVARSHDRLSSRQFSQEFRLESPQNDRFSWLVGTHLFTEQLAEQGAGGGLPAAVARVLPPDRPHAAHAERGDLRQREVPVHRPLQRDGRAALHDRAQEHQPDRAAGHRQRDVQQSGQLVGSVVGVVAAGGQRAAEPDEHVACADLGPHARICAQQQRARVFPLCARLPLGWLQRQRIYAEHGVDRVAGVPDRLRGRHQERVVRQAADRQRERVPLRLSRHPVRWRRTRSAGRRCRRCRMRAGARGRLRAGAEGAAGQQPLPVREPRC